jgi:hypothetical protein
MHRISGSTVVPIRAQWPDGECANPRTARHRAEPPWDQRRGGFQFMSIRTKVGFKERLKNDGLPSRKEIAALNKRMREKHPLGYKWGRTRTVSFDPNEP